jgi:adenosine kinase
MSFSHMNRVADAAYATLAIVSPDGRQGMIEHTRDLAAAKVPYIFDPGQGPAALRRAGAAVHDGGARALAVNDYEARIVEQKTGRKVEDLSRDLVVFVTRAAAGSSVYVTVNGSTSRAFPRVGGRSDRCGDAYRAGLLYGMARGWAGASARSSPRDGVDQDRAPRGQNHRPARDDRRRFQAAFGETL